MITSYVKNFLIEYINRAFSENDKYIQRTITDYANRGDNLRILDVGCGPAKTTEIYVKNIQTKYEIYGIDLLPLSAKDLNIGLKYTQQDFSKDKLPYNSETFDIVISNQVIEHLVDKDHYLSEIYRVLNNKGMFIISTENIASCDNLLSIILGQEPISQHTSGKYYSSSILSPHFMKPCSNPGSDSYGRHVNVCSYFGLQRLVKINGFDKSKISIKGFGHIHPFFENVLPIYNRIITLVAIK